MVESITYNTSINKHNPYWITGKLEDNQSHITTDTLAYQPQTDKVEFGNKQSMSKTKKILLCLGSIAMTALATIYSIRKFQVKNIQNVQKAFQEVFMRDDISLEQAREMLKRYKEIEKIADDKEYAKALFKEAKKNFGFEKSKIQLVFKDKEGASGYCNRTNEEISITPKCSRTQMLDTIHHEFRHAKQHNIIFNLYPEEYLGARVIVDSYAVEMIKKGLTVKDINIEELWSKALKEYREKGIDLTNRKNKLRMENYKEILQKYFVKEPVPDKYKQWADKCKNGMRNYVGSQVNFTEYWNNFTEIDARYAGRKMSKYIKSKAFTPNDWISDIFAKYGMKFLNRFQVSN